MYNQGKYVEASAPSYEGSNMAVPAKTSSLDEMGSMLQEQSYIMENKLNDIIENLNRLHPCYNPLSQEADAKKEDSRSTDYIKSHLGKLENLSLRNGNIIDLIDTIQVFVSKHI